MPEFTTVSVQEAQMRTIPGRQGNLSMSTLTISNSFRRDKRGSLR
jgi:hypothetical protein